MPVDRPNSLRRLALAATAGWLALPCGAARAAGAPLRVGLAPYLSPAALLQAFRPIREHVERSLSQRVEMVTARDFATLIEATRRGDFDVALVPAHIASLAASDWRFVLLAASGDAAAVEMYVRADSPIRRPADLRGTRVGMLDALSLTASVGRQWLQEQGLLAAVTVVALPSINSALIALDRGEVEAVVAANSQLLNLPPATPRTERVLAPLAEIPGPIWIAHPRLARDDVERVRTALTSFRPDPSQPKTASNSVMQSLGAERLARLEPFAAQVRRTLAQRP